MTTYTNAELVASRTRLARRVSLGGLAILAPGAIISFMGLQNPDLQGPNVIMLTYVSLVLGTIAVVIGGRLAEQWLIAPRDDQRLDKALKGLDRRYRLVNYYTPVRHVLLSPGALYVIIMKDERGPIRFDGKRWSQPFSLGRLWRESRYGGLGVPTYEGESEARKLAKWLQPKLGDSAVHIQPLIVFSHPGAELEIAAGHDEIMPLKGIKPYLLRRKETLWSPATYESLAAALVPSDESDAEPDDEAPDNAAAEPAPASAPPTRRRKARR